MFTLRISEWLVNMPMAFIALAGAMKAADVPAFVDSMSSWSFVPEPLRVPIGASLPLIELAVGGLSVVGVSRRFAPLVGCCLLSTFTVVFAAHWAFATPPDCHCLGRLVAFEESRHAAAWVVARNLILGGSLFAGLVLRWRSRESRNTTPVRRPGIAPAIPPGFTLVETLLVIALLVVLAALLIPSLSSARRTANSLVSLSNLRSHAAIMEAYTGDYRGIYPFLTDPNATRSVIRGGGHAVLGNYFLASRAWNIGLANGYYDGDALHLSFYAPGDPDGYLPADIHPVLSSYSYSCNFFTRPEYWNESTRRAPPFQWAPVRAAEVRFPSSKAILSAFHPLISESIAGVPEPQRTTVMGMADSSALRPDPGSLGPQYSTGDWSPGFPSDLSTIHGGHGLHTIDGVKGRDIR